MGRPSPHKVCTITGCRRPHYGHGLCNSHWRFKRLYGDPLIRKTLSYDKWQRCQADPDCPRVHEALGLCGTHYKRVQKARLREKRARGE